MGKRKVQVTAIYCRVSTQQQVSDGPSLDNQEELLRRIAEYRWPDAMIEVYRDVGSGRRTARPAYARLMRAIRSGWVARVCCTELSRLWRSASDALSEVRRMEEAGCELYAASNGVDTSTAIGRMFFGLMSVLAQWESDQTAERVKRAHAVARAAGRKGPGRRPYGWTVTDTGSLVRCDSEQAVLDYVLELRAGGTSWDKIAAKLNAENHGTVSGRDWEAGGLRLVTKAAIIRRGLVRGGEVAEGSPGGVPPVDRSWV